LFIEDINLKQTLPFYPAALEFYQFVKATDLAATFVGVFLDRFGRSIGSFVLEIEDAPIGFDEIPSGAVGVIGQLNQPVYVNTGLEIESEGVPLTSEASWIEYPNDRLAIGAVI